MVSRHRLGLAFIPLLSSCANVEDPSMFVSDPPGMRKHCAPNGWWMLRFGPTEITGAGCRTTDQEKRRYDLSGFGSIPIEVRPDEHGNLLVRSVFGEAVGSFDESSCRLRTEISRLRTDLSAEATLFRTWEGGPLVWIEFRFVYDLYFDGSALTGWAGVDQRASRPACGAPCTALSEVDGRPMRDREIAEARKEFAIADEEERRSREESVAMTPEHREELLAPIRKYRGPGSCWRIDED